MRPSSHSRFFRPARAAIRLICTLAFFIVSVAPSLTRAQVTQNKYVSALSEGGFLTLYQGNPGNNERLSFHYKSYLTVLIDGKYYTNNPYGGKLGPNGRPVPTPSPIVNLSNGQDSKIGDTLETVWNEGPFDIVQDAYPVEFTNSGVIVIAIKIVNHSSIPITSQAQYLLDNQNTSTKPGGGADSSNDNPYLITRYGYVRDWQDCPPKPIPSFYLAFEYSPSDVRLATVGIGYVNDSFPPRPLGLLPLQQLEFGDWQNQTDYTWGLPSGADRLQFKDEAALMIGKPVDATAFVKGAYDSVTTIFRTAYGIPEWCYDHGKIVGFALYPHHIQWDPRRRIYTPNPFQVETFMFPVGDVTASATTITQTVGDPVRIVNPPGSFASGSSSQKQQVGTIPDGGFADVRWTDSVTVLPNGCAASFPIDLHFDVTASGIDLPIFQQPWDCSIMVDCAHPDTIPPTFKNTFVGCDSIQYDTATVKDNAQYDLGLKDITYSSPDLSAAQYSVTISPAPTFSCLGTPVKVFVRQVDTAKAGHVILLLTDCAGNISRDTMCFTAHPPLPDLTQPRFWIDSAVADCHAQCTKWTITDTASSTTSIDRGIDSIVALTATNMTLSGVPQGGKFVPPAPSATVHVCVTDSMLDGMMVLRSNDTTHNFEFDTIHYCTTPDTHPPIVTQSAFDVKTNSWHVHVSDTQAWDRGIDSVLIDQVGNVVTIPAAIPNPIGCKRTYDFDVKVIDTSKCARVSVWARDCVGHSSIPFILSFTKGAKPVLVPAKTVLCTPTDSVVLDAGGTFAAYQWSSGQATRKIVVQKAGTYSVTVDDGVGCSATSDPVTITTSLATPLITPPGPVEVCAPDSIELDASAGFASYQWLKDGSMLPGEVRQTHWATVSGIYTATVTNAAGCNGATQPVTITIDPLPPPPVITSANNVLTSTSAATYQWFLDGAPIPGATSQTYTPTSGGTYSVKITDAHGCSSTSLPLSNSGSTVIGLPSMVLARESEHVTIPLSIVTSQNIPQGINRTYTVIIRFNKTLLVPDGPVVSSTADGDDLVVQYTGQTSATQGILQNLPFIVALGKDSCTTIKIDSFSWSTPNISVTRQNGNFCLTGLCTQGGTRLINPEGKFSLSAARPNPTPNSIQIDYEIIERGRTTLVVSDLLGHEVLRLVDADQEPGAYSVGADLSSLPVGAYIYSLRSPTIVRSHQLQIVR